jgi:hypothetical protein
MDLNLLLIANIVHIIIIIMDLLFIQIICNEHVLYKIERRIN